MKQTTYSNTPLNGEMSSFDEALNNLEHIRAINLAEGKFEYCANIVQNENGTYHVLYKASES